MKIFLRLWKKALAHKLISLVVLVVVVGAGYCVYGKMNSGATPVQYVTATTQKGTLIVSVSGSGQVTASNQVNVQPRVSGTVSRILVNNNQQVKAGQILVELDATNDERAVRDAQTNLENAQLSLQELIQPATTSSILQAQQTGANFIYRYCPTAVQKSVLLTPTTETFRSRYPSNREKLPTFNSWIIRRTVELQ